MFKYVKFNKIETEYTVLEFRGGDESVKVNHFDMNIVSVKSDVEEDIDALIDSQVAEIACELITLEEFKALAATTAQFVRLKEIIKVKYSNEVAILTSQYPVIERETWTMQLSQAKAFKISEDEEDAPFLKILADAENDTILNFADAVIAKAGEYEAFMAIKLVEKRAHEKSLMNEIGIF